MSLTTRDITLKECRTVTTLKYLLLFNRLHYILNDHRTISSDMRATKSNIFIELWFYFFHTLVRHQSSMTFFL